MNEEAALRMNPEMLVLARESRGLLQSELAKRLSITQGYLSKLEANLLDIADPLLLRISQVLDYPVEFFLQPERIYGPGSSELFHRSHRNVPSRVLRTVHGEINKRIIHIAKLLQAVDRPDSIPHLDLEEYGSPDEVARAVRAAWQLSPGPVRDLTKVIEDAGGIVVRVDFATRHIDAISRWVPGLPPMFFINRDAPSDRERLSLAHELGHMVMHVTPRPEMEREAYQFGAEMLMPAKEINPYLHDVSLAKLAALKPYWRVSMGAILHRASDLDKITPRKARSLWMQFRQAGYDTCEPAELDFPKERPTLLLELLDLYRSEFQYTLSDFAKKFALHDHEVQSLYQVQASSEETRRMLRVVDRGEAAG